jgi:hypothetical protein
VLIFVCLIGVGERLARDSAQRHKVRGEVNRGHTTTPKLALEPVAVRKRALELAVRVWHQVPFTSRSKRGLPRSGAKVGSILSQPARGGTGS